MSTGAKPIDPGWRTRDILRAAALVAGVYVALQLLWVGRSVFLIGFFGVLLGIVLAAGVDWLERYRVPRGVGAVLLVLLIFGALTGLGLLTAPQISRQLGELRQQVPQVIDDVERWVQQRGGGVAEIIKAATDTSPQASDASRQQGDIAQQQEDTARQQEDTARQQARQQADAPPSGTAGRQSGSERQSDASAPQGQGDRQQGGGQVDLRKGITQQLAGVGRHFFSVFSSTVAVLGGLIIMLFVAIFVAVDPGLYHRGLMHLFPHRSRRKAGEVLSATATTLRRWLLMQMVAMLAIGAVTTVVLLLLDVKAAIALGIIAGLLEFIPYVGPILSAVPAIAMALVDGPEKAIYVALAYTAIQQLEGVVLQPLLMKEGLELPPVVTILGQALFSLVFGFLGLLLAVPLLASVMVPLKLLYVRDVVGDEVTVPGEESG
ncbi:MAG TPA: AI-2E family transporter [Gemmatimonadales bacterium]|nr:AI-2E family transporter [Gemmatimonadales bacterium]